MTYLREDQTLVQVTIDGVVYGDGTGHAWKTASGGVLAADDSKTRPGGMGHEVALGGPAQRDDITCQIQWSDLVSNWDAEIEPKVGWARVKVARTPLDARGVPIAGAVGKTVQGILKSTSVPDTDSESSDAAMYEIVVSLDELSA